MLPAVLARSEAEAAQLLAHLPLADEQRLSAVLLCLRLMERRHGTLLPDEVFFPLLLAACESDSAPSDSESDVAIDSESENDSDSEGDSPGLPWCIQYLALPVA